MSKLSESKQALNKPALLKRLIERRPESVADGAALLYQGKAWKNPLLGTRTTTVPMWLVLLRPVIGVCICSVIAPSLRLSADSEALTVSLKLTLALPIPLVPCTPIIVRLLDTENEPTPPVAATPDRDGLTFSDGSLSAPTPATMNVSPEPPSMMTTDPIPARDPLTTNVSAIAARSP